MIQRILALAQKELIQIRREKRTLAMMIAIPLLWLVLFGYAFSFDVDTLTVAVVDRSGTETGARVVKAVREYDRFQLLDLESPTDAGIRDSFYRDQVTMAIFLPEGFGAVNSDVPMRVMVDGSDLFASQTGARLISKALEPLQTEIRVETAERIKAELSRQLKAQAGAAASGT